MSDFSGVLKNKGLRIDSEVVPPDASCGWISGRWKVPILTDPHRTSKD
jgi:hypothetical protein